MTASAISGTRRAMKELVDGTIRVQIDIDPIYRADFHRLFPEIDMAVALTPLRPTSAEPEKAAVSPAKPAGFPDGLTGLAVRWCQDERFWRWAVNTLDPLPDWDADVGPVWAKEIILRECQISSRKELDTNPDAAERFNSIIREPFRKALAEE